MIVTRCLLVGFLLSMVSQNITSAADAKPLKVFILAGQSNMQGHANVSTFDAMRLNPQAAPLLELMRTSDDQPASCEDVWIASIGSSDEEKTGKLTVGYGAENRGPKIGPEFTFGLTVDTLIDGPVLIIKTAWGGKSIHTDFRPPSAGPYKFTTQQLEQFEKQGKDIAQIKADKKAATGHYYRLMTEYVKNVLADPKRIVPEYDADAGYELAGFVWFQGWNDMVDSGHYPDRGQPGGYDDYSRLLAQFIDDVRKDLNAPKLPFVIGVMGVGGPTAKYDQSQQRYKATHQNFRDAMAAPASMPKFEGNVTCVLTENFWDMQVVELRKRENEIKPQVEKIRQQIKDGKLARNDGEEKIEKLYAETFDERELEILQQSTSNFDFHYMGSAGIMGQIGKAFAEAAVELAKSQPANNSR